MGTYVNTDSLALLAAAMILYAWVSYLREDWTWKNCILLAVFCGGKISGIEDGRTATKEGIGILMTKHEKGGTQA